MLQRSAFVIKWIFLIAFAGSVLTTYHLIASQTEQNFVRRFYAERNPKFRPAVMRRNKTITAINASVAIERRHFKPEIASVWTSTPLSDDNSEHSVQIFYYPWYGNPEFDDGNYYHWNHKYLPHWDPLITEHYPTGSHTPPADLGSSFYPLLGPYSSRDPAVIEQHMKWMSAAGIDVIVVSWFPPRIADEQGHPWNDLIPILLNATEKYRMKLSFHMEPYKNRNAESLLEDIKYIIDNYGSHPALYRKKRMRSRKMNDKNDRKNNRQESESKYLPLFYFYDSYLVPFDEWKKLTISDGKYTIRDTKYDILFVGLLVKSDDRYLLLDAGFDGMYTYFAAEGFSYGSTSSNWPSLSAFCRKNGLLFIPSVGPGYDDRRVRPWNEVNYRDRINGEYYAKMFEMAHTARANIVTITSFNEWHEGTQIEPAVPFVDNITGYVYSNYRQGPEQYLHQTLDLVKKYFTPLDRIAPEKIANII